MLIGLVSIKLLYVKMQWLFLFAYFCSQGLQTLKKYFFE